MTIGEWISLTAEAYALIETVRHSEDQTKVQTALAELTALLKRHPELEAIVESSTKRPITAKDIARELAAHDRNQG